MSGDSGATAFPEEDNLFHWVGTITGAPETVYDGHTYRLSIKFPADYPFTAPTIKFLTPCYHPNVDQYGDICLDILKERWSAAYSASTVLTSLRSLLSDPNNDSPLNVEAANLWDNTAEYERVLARKYAEAQEQESGSDDKHSDNDNANGSNTNDHANTAEVGRKWYQGSCDHDELDNNDTAYNDDATFSAVDASTVGGHCTKLQEEVAR